MLARAKRCCRRQNPALLFRWASSAGCRCPRRAKDEHAEISAPVSPAAGSISCWKLATCMEQFAETTPRPVQKLTATGFELIASLNIFNQRSRWSIYPMGVAGKSEICQRRRFPPSCCGLAELFPERSPAKRPGSRRGAPASGAAADEPRLVV